jgi:superfamily II DNA or RNA helicase/HKD family nuclease
LKDFPSGIYDLLHTTQLHDLLENAGLLDSAVWSLIKPEDLKHYLAIPLAHEIAGYISEVISGKKGDDLNKALDEFFKSPEALSTILELFQPKALQNLKQIKPKPPIESLKVRPDTPLAISALLTGSSRSPALRSQLIKELATCDRADWLVSFIKYAGILPLLPTLKEFTQSPSPDGKPKLRIATTSYMGATDLKAIKVLQELPNTEIRVSYDTKRTRLHAKVYLFQRNTGFGSAYIGSANISKAALDEGLEWTAKISQYEMGYLWQYAIATFESHWEDETEFTVLTKQDLPKLEQALSVESGKAQSDDAISFFDLRPFGFQQAILEDISAERTYGKHKHLVIAATGTGKTMIAAFDYKKFCEEQGGRPRLLFVAHREEILKQARSAFWQVLRDGSFGELVMGGSNPNQNNHLFCTVQSWNSRNLNDFEKGYFDYVVLDEAHHASADSYQRLIDHINPKTLIGLTATPERTDGKDIRDDFGGSFTHEIRLPEAIERVLLSPFHYFGVPDLDGLNFSSLAWKRGGYDITQLQNKLDGNVERARWVMSQVERYVADMRMVRGLGFCVSVAHAKFMAQFCADNNIPAIVLSAETDKTQRRSAQLKLEQREINFIFTVDLYNEGVDIPFVDTVLFLRPTESLTLFLQQLGRGLRLHDEKPHLTVLDFIAPQHRNFNYAKRFQALTSRPELRIDKQIESDMPYVPVGCLLHLEEQAKEHVLNNIRSATASLRGQKLINELQLLRGQKKGDITLQNMLDFLHLDSPDEIYKRGLPHVLLAKADRKSLSDDLMKFNKPLAKAFRRIALWDDTQLIENSKRLIKTGTSDVPLTRELLHSVLWSIEKPKDGTLEQVQDFLISRKGLLHDLKELLNYLIAYRTPLPKIQFKSATGPLNLHASYTREQVLLSLGLGSFESPRSSREGVLHVPERKLDVFFADINKSEADFTPTTMYEDYAITDKLFHWQSQSQTSDTSPVGKRYINHHAMGYTQMLFIRDRKKLSNGLTSPYFFAGPLEYRQHEGAKPISFVSELKHSLPAKVLSWARRV